MFTCDNLTAARSGRVLFSGIGFSLLPGACMAVTGANGSGKTTLLKTLCGLLPLEGGQVYYGRVPAAQNPDFLGTLQYIGHRNGCFEELSVAENLEYWAGLRGEPMLVSAAMHHFGLGRYAHAPYYKLSAGWQRRVALARLLVNPRAKLWLLDEPYAHLDEDGVARLNAILQSQEERGGIVIYTTHQAQSLHINIIYNIS